jgi:alanine dehydrogenase
MNRTVTGPLTRQPILVTDSDVETGLDPHAAVAVCRAAIRDNWTGSLGAPARQQVSLGLSGQPDLVFTAGGRPDRFGFRVYLGLPACDELVSVWNESGDLEVLVAGGRLGQYRTGAIGAVAVDALARPGPITVGVVGAGNQAWTQLWALQAARRISEIWVASRSRDRAEHFAARVRDRLSIDTVVLPARDAVATADVVLLATGAAAPVIEAEWVRPDAHITTIARNTATQYEIPLALLADADLIVTDSPQQIRAYPDGYVTDAINREPDHLGAVLAGDLPGRGPRTGITVFCSVGLAGTEVMVATTLVPPPHVS